MAWFFHKLNLFYAHNSHLKMFVEFMRFVDGHDPQDLNQLLLLTGFILFIYLENGSSQAEAFITFLWDTTPYQPEYVKAKSMIQELLREIVAKGVEIVGRSDNGRCCRAGDGGGDK